MIVDPTAAATDPEESYLAGVDKASIYIGVLNEHVFHRGEAPEVEDAGVSVASYGLADTGSFVLAPSPDEPRQRHLVPAVHISLLDEERILPGLAIRADLPSALVTMTGRAAAPTSSA